MLADGLGSEYLPLDGLTVPALVIGSTMDRLLPFWQSAKIAKAVPNLVELVELPGGHCAILERPHEVNRFLRELVASVTPAHATSGSVYATDGITLASKKLF